MPATVKAGQEILFIGVQTSIIKRKPSYHDQIQNE